MLIDPFTVIAQIVNFALLVWLLRRVLYGPVMRAMEAREERIRDEVERARRLHAEAEAEGERYRDLLADFEAEREARLMEVRSEIERERQERIREVRAEVMALRERWLQGLEQEKETFLRELRLHIAQTSLAVMRDALKQLADAHLEARFVARFLDRLRTMDGEDRLRFVAALRQGEALRVHTAFPLSAPQRASITAGIAELFDIGTKPEFETNPDLVAGVELRAGGLAVAWTLDEYLVTLEAALQDAIHEALQPESLEPAAAEAGESDVGR